MKNIYNIKGEQEDSLTIGDLDEITNRLQEDDDKSFKRKLYLSFIATPLGLMVAIADEEYLYLLEFTRSKNIKSGIQKLCNKTKSFIVLGESLPIISIKQELIKYFIGELRVFNTPLCMMGTELQKKAWTALKQIPYGKTYSYKEQAESIGKPTAYRAVANSNSANQLAIIIPCHRIINSNGDLGGYKGGIYRKMYLLEHEKNILQL